MLEHDGPPYHNKGEFVMVETVNRLPYFMKSSQPGGEPGKDSKWAAVVRFVQKRWAVCVVAFLAFDVGCACGIGLGYWAGRERAPEPSEAAQRLAEELIRERATNGM